MKLTIPNQLTILRIVLTPVFLYFFLYNTMEYKLIGTIIFIFAAATDWYDGYVARKFNVITRWGQFMDPLADKILISSALCVFAYLGYIYWWMIIVIVVRDFFITFLTSLVQVPSIPSVRSSFREINRHQLFCQMENYDTNDGGFYNDYLPEFPTGRYLYIGIPAPTIYPLDINHFFICHGDYHIYRITIFD